MNTQARTSHQILKTFSVYLPDCRCGPVFGWQGSAAPPPNGPSAPPRDGLLDDDVPLGRAGLDDLWADDDEDEGPSAEQQRKALLKPPGGIADKVSEMKQREQKRREAAENEEQEKLKAQEERNKDIDLVNAAPRKLSRAQRFGRRLARKKRAFFGRSTAGYDDCFESLAAVGLEEHDMQTLRLAYRAIDEEHEGEQAPTSDVRPAAAGRGDEAEARLPRS